MKLDDRTIELIAVGASVTAGCHHCLEHHAGKARKLGAGEDEVAEAIAVGRMVRGGSASQMDRFIERLAEGEPSGPSIRDTSDLSGATGAEGGE
jgi:AhpD family alkylhydroperoxidase